MKPFIRRCREEAGLTQEQLADKMNVTVASVQNWESGRCKPSFDKYQEFAVIFNVPVDKIIKELLIEGDKSRSDRWPDFLFDDDTNGIVDNLHLNMAQQDLFGLLYIYGAEYLERTSIGVDTFGEDLKRIPYGFIEKVGSIQFLNQSEGLHKVIKHIRSDFLMKVLKLNPYSEFDIKTLPKNLICEFIDAGYKGAEESELAEEGYEEEERLEFNISMKKAQIILPVLEKNGSVHMTDGSWASSIRSDIPEPVFVGILNMLDFDRALFEDGYYEKSYNMAYIRAGLEKVTDYMNVSKGEKEKWVWRINKKGRNLLKWFRE